MKVIDNILLEWSYRCPDGIVDMNNPEKAKILFEILNEADSKQELVDLINTTELSPEQIGKLKKYVAGRVSQSSTNADLEKQFAERGLKRVGPLVVYLANNFDVEDKLLDYMKGGSQPTLDDLKNNNNLFTLFSESGLPEDFLKKLAQTTSNQLGAGELLLITMLKDAKKLQAKSGQGDIQVGSKIIELKGKGATISEWGSKAPIRAAFEEVYKDDEEKLKKLDTKNDNWLKQLFGEFKDKAKEILDKLYPPSTFTLNTSNIETLKKSIAEGFADQYFKDSNVTSILVLDEMTGNYRMFGKEDFKKALGNEIKYSFTKDTAPRISLSDEQTKVDEELSLTTTDITLEDLLKQEAK